MPRTFSARGGTAEDRCAARMILAPVVSFSRPGESARRRFSAVLRQCQYAETAMFLLTLLPLENSFLPPTYIYAYHSSRCLIAGRISSDQHLQRKIA